MSHLRVVFTSWFAILISFGIGQWVCAAEQPGKPLVLDLGQGVTMRLAKVPSGKFLMGSKMPAAEVAQKFGGKAERHTNEHPRREVTMSRPFYLGIHEVTQAQWRAVVGTEPWKDKISGEPGDRYAASWMNWFEANEF